MEKLFVFGTLKRGFPLHDEGLRGARYLGMYRTTERFPMVVAGPRYAPMMLNQPGVGRQVKGELYDIDDMLLSDLDALEFIGKPGNYRVVVQVEPMESGQPCSAFAYMKSPELAAPRHTGHLDDYQDRRFVR